MAGLRMLHVDKIPTSTESSQTQFLHLTCAFERFVVPCSCLYINILGEIAALYSSVTRIRTAKISSFGPISIT